MLLSNRWESTTPSLKSKTLILKDRMKRRGRDFWFLFNLENVAMLLRHKETSKKYKTHRLTIVRFSDQIK